MELDSQSADSLSSMLHGFQDELPTWDCSEDILDGFDEYLALLPATVGIQDADVGALVGLSSSSGQAGPQDAAAQAPVNRSPSSRSTFGSRKMQNRNAQRRFRQRQQVDSSSLDLPAIMLPVHKLDVSTKVVPLRGVLRVALKLCKLRLQPVQLVWKS